MANQENDLENKSGSSKKKVLISLGIFLLVVLIGAGGILAFESYVNGKLPRGTKVAGIDFSYKNVDEAKGMLKIATTNYSKNPINVQLGDEMVEVTPVEAGISFKADRVFDEVKTLDSSKASVFELMSNDNAPELNLVYEVDYTEFLMAIDRDLDLSEDAPRSANFYFGEEGELLVQKGEKGTVIDYEKLQNDLDQRLSKLNNSSLVLETSEAAPLVSGKMVESQRDEIVEILNRELVLDDPKYSDDWYITLADNRDWVKFEPKNSKFPFVVEEVDFEDGSYVRVALEQWRLDEYIDLEISEWLDKRPGRVDIYKDEEGEVVIDGKGHDGTKVERKKFREDIEVALAAGENVITVPFKTLKPNVNVSEEFAAQGIKEKLGEGYTTFYGSSAGRIHNVKHGFTRFNGVIVPQGEEFSFNEILGPVEYSTGYKGAYVIRGGDLGTRVEPGGGVCQDSTTVYRAILFSGLPVTERHGHSYVVNYYEQVLGRGLDATIYPGGPNLKFLNDTPGDILIHAYVEDDAHAHVVFYGTSDGRSVEMEGPYSSGPLYPGPAITKTTTTLPPGARKQVENAHVGYNLTWYRHITHADGTTEKETIDTHYRAIPARILVGAGAAEGGE